MEQENDRFSHIYIDCENVSPKVIVNINTEKVVVVAILGVQQELLADRLREYKKQFSISDKLMIVQHQIQAKNSLDFRLAFEVGARAAYTKGVIYVLSKDNGFKNVLDAVAAAGSHCVLVPDSSHLPKNFLIKRTEEDNAGLERFFVVKKKKPSKKNNDYLIALATNLINKLVERKSLPPKKIRTLKKFIRKETREGVKHANLIIKTMLSNKLIKTKQNFVNDSDVVYISDINEAKTQPIR